MIFLLLLCLDFESCRPETSLCRCFHPIHRTLDTSRFEALVSDTVRRLINCQLSHANSQRYQSLSFMTCLMIYNWRHCPGLLLRSSTGHYPYIRWSFYERSSSIWSYSLAGIWRSDPNYNRNWVLQESHCHPNSKGKWASKEMKPKPRCGIPDI